MIVVTGAAGFVGSCLISRLNSEGFNYIIAVDDFSFPEKQKNLEGKKIKQFIEREVFIPWLEGNAEQIECIFHIGARTDTASSDEGLLNHLNLNYTKALWTICTNAQIPFIYASSAATYGLGEQGYDDDHSKIPNLQPLNLYGWSKQHFDTWALNQEEAPFFWAGLKFFNVYGPNEYHKGRMASVIFHTFHQIQKTGTMNLFKSHNPNYTDGGQMRDFVYVKDVVEVLMFLMHHRKNSGIYNLGSGQARTFYDLAANTFKALQKEPNIGFIDTPADIRDKYQYFTEANMNKLKSIGYTKDFHTLEEGIDDYVKGYLSPAKYY